MEKATELLTAAEMRAIERAAIETGTVSGLTLMERAGEGVVAAIRDTWPALAGPSRAVVFCGPGNNGGDGFVIARLLKQRGFEVDAYLLGYPEKLPADARRNCERWREMGDILPWPSRLEGRADLYIDALFGAGLSRALDAEVLGPLRQMSGGKLVAVDAPSGLCMDSGRPLGEAVKADLTVTFHAPRPGHYLAEGPAHCGKVICKPIGLKGSGPGRTVRLEGPVAPVLKSSEGHKYSHGHALVLTGGAGKTGAARMAARGALRIGAGLVTLGVPGSAQLEVAAQSTAVMLTRIEDADGLERVLEDDRIRALCLGPGLGAERALALVPAALRAEPQRGVVLDADALTAFADDPSALFSAIQEGCILTPHGGEFARLFPDIARKLREEATDGPAFSKIDAVREAAERAGCVVLLKGHDTVVAAPDGRCLVNAACYERAAPWLATAGAGDVLAGFATGLLARGINALEAASTATWLHVEAALEFGPGLIAEDLPETLPALLRRQAAGRRSAGRGSEESSSPPQ